MQEKFKIYWIAVRSDNRKMAALLVAAFAVAALGFWGVGALNANNLAAVATSQQESLGGLGVEVATVGEETDGSSSIDSSWAGEIISLSNLPVQPAREGTLEGWYVHIGERVYKGQRIGRLSEPPAMPDSISMLAEQASMLSMSRTNTEAQRTYVKERIAQLEALRKSVTDAQSQTAEVVNGSNTAYSMVEIKRQNMRGILRGSLVRVYPMLSGNKTLPTRFVSVELLPMVGAQNSKLRDTFPAVLYGVIAELEDPSTTPIESGLAYFESAIKLADTSLSDSTMFTDESLNELKTMLHMGQQDFIMAVDQLRTAELMAVEKKTMFFEQLRMIDNDIAMLSKDLAMAEGETKANEESYRTVENAIRGGYDIIAPQSGIISTIMFKPGEFVEPGMPVAVISSQGDRELIVRISIPSNIRKPAIGDLLRVTRPGFSDEIRTAKLIGIGAALDEMGSYMADATFVDEIDWPVGASVRVALLHSGHVLVPESAIWSNEEGKRFVWAVSAGDRIYAKEVTVGRTVGASVEIYGGLTRGGRYIVETDPSIREDMLLSEVELKNEPEAATSGNEGHEGH